MASSSNTTEEPAPPWVDLPRDITAAILHKLGPVEILKTAQLVCSQWWSVCRDPSMWRCIHIPLQRGLFKFKSEEICRYLVDRSRGQLIDININHFGSDELLLYISQRSSSLKRLQLIFTYEISKKGIIEAVKNLPLLEELHMYFTDIDAEAIEAIGRSCPQLKSFKLNRKWYRVPPVVCDLEARAIAQYMYELRHLQLFGNRMTNEGVQAIIDGCSHLESLDLRQCFNIHFGGDIERLYLQRIKDLRLPNDPTDDYPFDVKPDEDYMNDTIAYDYMMQENRDQEMEERLQKWLQEMQELRRPPDEDYRDELVANDYMMQELRRPPDDEDYRDELMTFDNMFELRKTPSKKKIKGKMKKHAK